MSDPPSPALKSETTPPCIGVVASRQPSNGSHLTGSNGHVDRCRVGFGVARGVRSHASADRRTGTAQRGGACRVRCPTAGNLWHKMIMNASEKMEE